MVSVRRRYRDNVESPSDMDGVTTPPSNLTLSSTVAAAPEKPTDAAAAKTAAEDAAVKAAVEKKLQENAAAAGVGEPREQRVEGNGHYRTEASECRRNNFSQ
jgi:hypothetical protein